MRTEEEIRTEIDRLRKLIDNQYLNLGKLVEAQPDDSPFPALVADTISKIGKTIRDSRERIYALEWVLQIE